MKKQIMTVAALGAALLAAGCTTNADRRAEQYAEAGGQMEYNIGVVKAEQERIQAEEYYAEQARQKAEAQKQAAKAKADKARAQANAKANAAKKLEKKRADFIVGNDVTRPGAGFDVATNIVTFYDRQGETALPLLQKTEVADRILDRVARLLREKQDT